MAHDLSVKHLKLGGCKTASPVGARLLLSLVCVQAVMGSRCKFVQCAVIAIQRRHKVGLSIQTKNVVERNALG